MFGCIPKRDAHINLQCSIHEVKVVCDFNHITYASPLPEATASGTKSRCFATYPYIAFPTSAHIVGVDLEDDVNSPPHARVAEESVLFMTDLSSL